MPAHPKVRSRHEAAIFLKQEQPAILLKWESESRKRVPAAREQTRVALRDSLPKFLDQLVETLDADDPKSESTANSDVAREHAEERAEQPDYSLDEVIFEYHILRSVLMEHLDSDQRISFEASQIVHDFIDRGISKAAIRYTQIESDRKSVQSKFVDEARVEAERGSHAKSAFLANMSHEIRTPLGSVMGFAGLLKEDGLTKNQVFDYATIIERSSQHLLRIIDDILDLTKVESGKMVIEKIEFSLVELLADFSSMAAMKARENGTDFLFNSQSAVPEFVTSDPTRLRQILSNVVGNAIKFTDNGHVELSVSFSGHILNLKVTDTGRGISDDQRKHLFLAFSQADSSTTRKYGGTGLGLVITKKLCQALGGDFLLLDSEIGKGSTFEASLTVGVPVDVKLVPLATAKAVVSESASQKDLRGLEVLLVEDSPDNQFLVQQMLSKSGARLTMANDGAAGVAAALAHRFDVILMDIQMPIMDGHEAVRTLRSKGYSAPIVALTAHAMKEERERAVQSGFSHFLTKPINRKNLLDLLGLLHQPIDLRL
ncbi:hypothetical protein BH10BDE1_BH10BDE1_04450 [soil metagenome]